MTKEIRLHAFAMNCTGHMAPGCGVTRAIVLIGTWT
jgi:hypothetical protein